MAGVWSHSERSDANIVILFDICGQVAQRWVPQGAECDLKMGLCTILMGWVDGGGLDVPLTLAQTRVLAKVLFLLNASTGLRWGGPRVLGS